MEYKNVKVRTVNGIKITSRTCVLTNNEEQEAFSKIKKMIIDYDEKQN